MLGHVALVAVHALRSDSFMSGDSAQVTAFALSAHTVSGTVKLLPAQRCPAPEAQHMCGAKDAVQAVSISDLAKSV
jgi:hypothetical protein